MKERTLRQRTALCRDDTRSSSDSSLARALNDLADDYERMAFDSIGPEDSLLARKPIGLHDCSTGNDERDSAVSNQQTIYLIDDDDFLRDSLRELLEEEGFHVIAFAAASAFLL